MRGIETLTVMLADDNRQMRVLMRSMLRAYGFRKIVEVANGADALAAARDYFIDIAFVDWAMSMVDGPQLTLQLRHDPAVLNPYCSIIMVSGHSGMQRVARARDCGVNTFLAKPVSARTLRQHLQFVFHEQRPFVRAPSYRGPDRRLGRPSRYGGPRRRSGDRMTEDTLYL